MSTADGAPADGAPPVRRDRTLGSWLRLLAKIALVLFLLGSLAVGGLFLLVVGSLPKAPTATTAPVIWATREISLTPEATTVHGTITLEAPSVPASDFGVGVNAGVPSVAYPAPGAALSGPLVRLRASAPGGAANGATTDCFAPCELVLPTTFDCSGGLCRMTIDVTVDLLPAASGQTSPVSLNVSGGLSARISKPLPSPFTVDIAFDAPPASAGPSGT